MMLEDKLTRAFGLDGRVVVITGGAGLLGEQHAAAVMTYGGTAVLLDVDSKGLYRTRSMLEAEFSRPILSIECDVTSLDSVIRARERIVSEFGKISALVNNAARNPKMELGAELNFSRLENFPLDQWNSDLSVGLGGAFNCSRVFGSHMAGSGEGGVIVNVASDLGVIAPDQRLYRQENVEDHMQPVKPVTYSVVKHGLIGLTKYLATYWCGEGVRCNSLSPGGVHTNQDEVFVSRISQLIPLGRMAAVDEYRGAIVFLCSDASSYMNGANLVIDGGRSAW
jgi:NAD(P)-dependent dehydrogenase (short-subunit alcohol dehydrogenase family)